MSGKDTRNRFTPKRDNDWQVIAVAANFRQFEEPLRLSRSIYRRVVEKLPAHAGLKYIINIHR